MEYPASAQGMHGTDGVVHIEVIQVAPCESELNTSTDTASETDFHIGTTVSHSQNTGETGGRIPSYQHCGSALTEHHVNIVPIEQLDTIVNEGEEFELNGEVLTPVVENMDVEVHEGVDLDGYQSLDIFTDNIAMQQPIVIQPEETVDEAIPDWTIEQPRSVSHDDAESEVSSCELHQHSEEANLDLPIKLEPFHANDAAATQSLADYHNHHKNAHTNDCPTVDIQNIKTEPEVDTGVCDVHNLKITNVKTERVKSEVEALFCILCEKYCESRVRLEDYLVQKPASDILCCDECDEHFQLKGEALHHAFKAHKGCRVFKRGQRVIKVCPICTMQMSHQGRLDLHIKNHSYHRTATLHFDSKEFSYLCADCVSKVHEVPAGILDMYKESEAQGADPSTTDLSCPHCSVRFPNLLALRFHILRSEIMKHKCTECASSFKDVESLRRHVSCKHPAERHFKHGKSTFELMCDQCPRSFPTIDDLKAHLKTHEVIRCNNCNKICRSNERLQRHLLFCGQELTLKSEVKRGDVVEKTMGLARKIVGQNTQYVCAHCPRVFKSQESLHAHLQEHLVRFLWFTCQHEKCTSVYNTFGELSTHVTSKHEGVVKCCKCHTWLWSEQMYDQHAGMCCGRYRCETCRHIFNGKSDMEGHECTKTVEVRPIAPKQTSGKVAKIYCPICPKNVISLLELKQHMAYHKENKKWFACQHLSCGYLAQEFEELCSHASDAHTCIVKCFKCNNSIWSKEMYQEHMKKCCGYFICKKCNALSAVEESSSDDICKLCIKKSTELESQIQKRKPLHCVSCQEELPSNRSVESYVKETDSLTFECLNCAEQFKDRSLALTHAYFQHVGCTVVMSYRGKAEPGHYKCAICTRLLTNRDDLENHMKGHTSLDWKCAAENCDWMFATTDECVNHLNDYHKKQLRNHREHVLCHHCIQKFNVAPSSLQNITKPIKCWSCKECFDDRSERRMHYNIEHSGLAKIDGDIFTCQVCLREYKIRKHFAFHIENHAKFQWECPDCGWAFLTESEVVAHAIEIHKEISDATVADILQFGCARCKVNFPHEDAFQSHNRKVHEEIGVACYKCKRCFVHDKSLELHIQDHVTMTHKCAVCYAAYDNKFSLEMHKPFCPGKRKLKYQMSFPCSTCKITFDSVESLQNHRLWEHANIMESVGVDSHNTLKDCRTSRHYVCHFCKQIFISKSDVYNHVNSAHLQLTPSSEKNTRGPKTASKGVFVCRMCDAEFMDVYAFKVHMSVNHPEWRSVVKKQQPTVTTLNVTTPKVTTPNVTTPTVTTHNLKPPKMVSIVAKPDLAAKAQTMNSMATKQSETQPKKVVVVKDGIYFVAEAAANDLKKSLPGSNYAQQAQFKVYRPQKEVQNTSIKIEPLEPGVNTKKLPVIDMSSKGKIMQGKPEIRIVSAPAPLGQPQQHTSTIIGEPSTIELNGVVGARNTFSGYSNNNIPKPTLKIPQAPNLRRMLQAGVTKPKINIVTVNKVGQDYTQSSKKYDMSLPQASQIGSITSNLGQLPVMATVSAPTAAPAKFIKVLPTSVPTTSKQMLPSLLNAKTSTSQTKTTSLLNVKTSTPTSQPQVKIEPGAVSSSNTPDFVCNTKTLAAAQPVVKAEPGSVITHPVIHYANASPFISLSYSPNECEYCKQKFTTATQLKSHIICQHEWKQTPSNHPRKIKNICLLCKQVFHGKGAFRIHLMHVHKLSSEQLWRIVPPTVVKVRATPEGQDEQIVKRKREPRVLLHRLTESELKKYSRGESPDVPAKRQKMDGGKGEQSKICTEQIIKKILQSDMCGEMKKNIDEVEMDKNCVKEETKLCADDIIEKNIQPESWSKMRGKLHGCENKAEMKKVWIEWAGKSATNRSKDKAKNGTVMASGEKIKPISGIIEKSEPEVNCQYVEMDEPLDLDLSYIPVSVMETIGELSVNNFLDQGANDLDEDSSM